MQITINRKDYTTSRYAGMALMGALTNGIVDEIYLTSGEYDIGEAVLDIVMKKAITGETYYADDKVDRLVIINSTEGHSYINFLHDESRFYHVNFDNVACSSSINCSPEKACSCEVDKPCKKQ